MRLPWPWMATRRSDSAARESMTTYHGRISHYRYTVVHAWIIYLLYPLYLFLSDNKGCAPVPLALVSPSKGYYAPGCHGYLGEQHVVECAAWKMHLFKDIPYRLEMGMTTVFSSKGRTDGEGRWCRQSVWKGRIHKWRDPRHVAKKRLKVGGLANCAREVRCHAVSLCVVGE